MMLRRRAQWVSCFVGNESSAMLVKASVHVTTRTAFGKCKLRKTEEFLVRCIMQPHRLFKSTSRIHATVDLHRSVLVAPPMEEGIASNSIRGNPSVVSTKSGPAILSQDTRLVDELLERTSLLISPTGTNLVAFSGGVDSSLVAYLVHLQKKDAVSRHNVAVLGVSPAVPKDQIEMAEDVASWIGIEFVKVYTQEGKDPTYIANSGQACFACKTHLYQALHAVADAAKSIQQKSVAVTLLNGTNADDKLDETRVGLLAAMQFKVQSPLELITKDDVRRASRAVGLPNWNYAASPCLRSRLAFGVEATAYHLKLIERAERFVRDYLLQTPLLQHQDPSNCNDARPDVSPNTLNLRVRFLANHRAAIELDPQILSLKLLAKSTSGGQITTVEDLLMTDARIQEYFKSELGFHQYIVRPFKSGSVAAVISNANSIALTSVMTHSNNAAVST